MDLKVNILSHLATAMIAGVAGAVVATSLRQSVILGYLLAGIAIGPFTPGFIGDSAAVEELAEVGIVFLMFVIGVQLSFRELWRAGRVALLGAVVQVLVMIGAGYGVGRALGWSHIESLFFGAVLSNSSSTVLGKVLAERDGTDTGPARTALAWSSVQDLSTIVLVAVLTALSGAKTSTRELGWNIGKTAIFLGVVVPFGLVVVPRLLRRIAALRNREIFALTAACLALGISWLSGLLGVSVALGAFLAGTIVSESELSERILGEAMPLRDIFSGLFFVSIGMLVDPRFALSHWPLVLLAAAMIVLVKGVVTTLVGRAVGLAWGPAVAVGAGLAQSAEFSLLMARVGHGLGVLSEIVFNVMLAGTVVSILFAPHAVRLGALLARRIAGRSASNHLAELAPAQASPRDHVIVCGHGRVGQIVTSLLREHRVPFVVIEEEQDIVRDLRDAGMTALLGDASRAPMLERAGLAAARLVVIAVPERLIARQIVDNARHLHPKIAVIARTHSDAEREHLQRKMGVDEAVIGELELALELGRRALFTAGVDEDAALASVERLRESPGEPAPAG